MSSPGKFHLEINSLADFDAFCAIIRGREEDPNDPAFQRMSAKLRGSTKGLEAAQAAQPKDRSTSR